MVRQQGGLVNVTQDGRRKWRPDRINRQIAEAIEFLQALDEATVRELHRRNQESNIIDGYASSTAPGSGSRGERRVLVVTEAGDEESVKIDSSTEAAAFRRLDGSHLADPLGDAIDRIFEIVESAAKDLREADRKRQVVIHSNDRRYGGIEGRESSLQGNCSVCGDMVTGVGADRLRRGLDPKCWVSWARWKLENESCGDPGRDFQRFAMWRRARLLTDESEAS